MKRLAGLIGVACWLLIIPVKLARRVDIDLPLLPAVVGLAPSFFGPLGLLLVILSSERRFPRVTIAQATATAGSIALVLEFAQALPLVRRLYTFDWLDVAVTLAALAAGAVLGALLRCAAWNAAAEAD
jgi:hypothetical protein